MPRVQSTPLIGLPLASGWSQVCQNENGNLHCSLAIAGNNAKNIGKDFLNRIQDLDANIGAQEIHQLILSFLKELRINQQELYLALVLFSAENKITFLTYNGSIILKRADKVGKILNSDQNLRIIQGEYQAGDLLVLSTKQLTHFIGEIKQKLSQGFEIETIITSLVPAVHALANSSLSALAFIKKDVEVKPVDEKKTSGFSFGLNIGKASIGSLFGKKSKKDKPETLDWQKLGPTGAGAAAATSGAAAKPISADKTSILDRIIQDSYADDDGDEKPEIGDEKQKTSDEKLNTPEQLNEQATETDTEAIKAGEVTTWPKVTAKPKVLDTETTIVESTNADESASIDKNAGTDPTSTDPASMATLIKRKAEIEALEKSLTSTSPSSGHGTDKSQLEKPSTDDSKITTSSRADGVTESLGPPEKPDKILRVDFSKASLNQILDKLKQLLVFLKDGAKKALPLLRKVGVQLAVISKAVIRKTKAVTSQSQSATASLKSATTSPDTNFPSGDIYLKPGLSNKTIRLILIFGTILIVVVGSIFFWRRQVKQEVQATEAEIAPFSQLLSEAQTVAEQDPIMAREKISLAVENLESLGQAYNQKKHGLKIVEAKLTEAKKFYQEISGREEFGDLKLLVDLRDLESDFVANTADLNQEKIAFLDQEKKQVIIINFDNQEHENWQVEDADKLIDISMTADSLYTLGSGVRRYHFEDNQKFVIKEEGDSDREAIAMDSFGPYLYLFNPVKRNIYRYAISKDKVSNPDGWLSSKKDLDFDAIDSMAIDGNIWLTTKDGQLKKFTNRNEETLEIKGLQEPFSSKIRVFAQEDFQYIYVLEADKNRVVILTPQGEYYEEKKSAALAGATDLVVSEKKGKIYVINGSLVFEIDI